MKCDKCRSEWKAQSNIQVKVCPFCGQKLLVETTDTVKTAMRWIVQNKGIEVLQDASLTNAFLSDLAVKDEAGRKKIRMALSAGLGNDFYKCYVKVKGNVGDIEVKMLQTQLQKDGFSEEFSIYVINVILYSLSLPEVKTIVADPSAIEQNSITSSMSATGKSDELMQQIRTNEKYFEHKCKVGDIVTFGSYIKERINGIKQAIEWLVLENDGQTAKLISRYGLDTKEYNEECRSITWEKCSLRKWLNGGFLDEAFTTVEQSMMETVSVAAGINPRYGTDPGKETKDKVFIPSIEEVSRWFSPDNERLCFPTKWAIYKGSDIDGTGRGSIWWLRSPGNRTDYAACVDRVGTITRVGVNVTLRELVRPVIVVRLSKQENER